MALTKFCSIRGIKDVGRAVLTQTIMFNLLINYVSVCLSDHWSVFTSNALVHVHNLDD